MTLLNLCLDNLLNEYFDDVFKGSIAAISELAHAVERLSFHQRPQIKDHLVSTHSPDMFLLLSKMPALGDDIKPKWTFTFGLV